MSQSKKELEGFHTVGHMPVGDYVGHLRTTGHNLGRGGVTNMSGAFSNRNDRQPRSLGRAPVGAPSKS
jgi:hypothetical protein